MTLLLNNATFDPTAFTKLYSNSLDYFRNIDVKEYIPQPVQDVLDHMFKPVEGDEYGRSAMTIDLDTFSGVTEHQMKQRAGMLVHEIVPLKHDADWVDRFEAWLDVSLGNMIHRP